MYRAMYASDTGLGITLQCHCSLVPRLLPGRKMGREPGRSDHVPCDILCVVCVILMIELLPTQSVLSVTSGTLALLEFWMSL